MHTPGGAYNLPVHNDTHMYLFHIRFSDGSSMCILLSSAGFPCVCEPTWMQSCRLKVQAFDHCLTQHSALMPAGGLGAHQILQVQQFHRGELGPAQQLGFWMPYFSEPTVTVCVILVRAGSARLPCTMDVSGAKPAGSCHITETQQLSVHVAHIFSVCAAAWRMFSMAHRH